LECNVTDLQKKGCTLVLVAIMMSITESELHLDTWFCWLVVYWCISL